METRTLDWTKMAEIVRVQTSGSNAVCAPPLSETFLLEVLLSEGGLLKLEGVNRRGSC